MKIEVVALNTKYARLVPIVRRALLSIEKKLSLANAYVEVYLAGDSFIPPPSRIPRGLAVGMKGGFKSFPRGSIPREKVGGFIQKNILAFPASANFPRPDLKGYRDLGELYLNPGYIKRHNEDMVYMIIHGLLHLLGYDHRGKRDTIAMEEKEKELLRHMHHGKK